MSLEDAAEKQDSGGWPLKLFRCLSTALDIDEDVAGILVEEGFRYTWKKWPMCLWQRLTAIEGFR